MNSVATMESLSIAHSILYRAWSFIWTLESGEVHGGVYVGVNRNVWNNIWVNVKTVVDETISTDKQLADAYSIIKKL